MALEKNVAGRRPMVGKRASIRNLPSQQATEKGLAVCDPQIDSPLAGAGGILIREMVEIHLRFAHLQVPTNQARVFQQPTRALAAEGVAGKRGGSNG